MVSARVKFGLFVLVVLGLPGGLMALDDPRIGDLGKLALILSPAVAGLVLSWGLGDRGQRARGSAVALAGGVTVAVVGLALAVAFIPGVAAFRQPSAGLPIVAQTIVAVALTSVLEELGWAVGGLRLAVAAFGRRVGVLILGLVWAAWHLIPTLLKIGLFPDLEAAPPAMLAAFVASCVVYRELLTLLQERARTWWAAAVGHALPNMLVAGLMAAGIGAFDLDAGWWAFPAPGGLFFLAFALIAVLLVRRTSASVSPGATPAPRPPPAR